MKFCHILHPYPYKHTLQERTQFEKRVGKIISVLGFRSSEVYHEEEWNQFRGALGTRVVGSLFTSALVYVQDQIRKSSDDIPRLV